MRVVIRRLCLLLLLVLVAPWLRAQPGVAGVAPAFTDAELDQILAPIALYPDPLLSQILMAATYPLEVVQAARWSRAHPGWQGQDAVEEVDDMDWDPSVKSLVAFPDILSMMDQKLEWTEDLGDAFLAQEDDVMDRVQYLRRRAEQAGYLQSGEHITVVRQGPSIIVHSAYRDVVYVPYYDPLVVYGAWWWPHHRPVYWSPWHGYRRHHHSGFYWAAGISLGSGFFYSDWDWSNRHVRVVEHPPFYYRHAPPPRRIWVHDRYHRRGVRYHDRHSEQRFAHSRHDRNDYRDGRNSGRQWEYRDHDPRAERRGEHRGDRRERDRMRPDTGDNRFDRRAGQDRPRDFRREPRRDNRTRGEPTVQDRSPRPSATSSAERDGNRREPRGWGNSREGRASQGDRQRSIDSPPRQREEMHRRGGDHQRGEQVREHRGERSRAEESSPRSNGREDRQQRNGSAQSREGGRAQWYDRRRDQP
jgi:Protein of unknown function (DUF3300)